jgi:hypothetical protein
MARRPSRRVVVFAVLISAIVGGWWWYGGNQRHLDDLMDTAYIYSGFPGDPDLHHLHYDRDVNLGDWCPDPNRDWIGGKAASRDDPVLGPQGAEPAAVRFEDEGWEVARRINLRVAGKTRKVYASRGNDKVFIAYFDGEISISASSGPCNAEPTRFSDDDETVPVDNFDD